MKALTTGLVVIGLLLVCSQAVGEEVKTLEEWGVPPIIQWVLAPGCSGPYMDWDGDGHKETILVSLGVGQVWIYQDYDYDSLGTEINTYLVPEMFIVTYRDKEKRRWYKIFVVIHEGMSAGSKFVYEDYDHDGLWTRRSL